jgi:hypothetical protein
MIATQAAITPLVEMKDERFDSEKCSEYELMMELGAERLRFFVLESATKRVLCLEDYSIGGLPNDKKWATWLGQLFQEHAFWGSTLWKNVTVCINTPSFTLIPDAYFRKEYANNYLGLIRGEIPENEQVLHQSVKKLTARNVFTVDKELWEWILNAYSLQLPTFLHQTSALIEGTLILSASEKSNVVMTFHFEDDFVTLTLAQREQLLFCNKFGYKTAGDMGYFVMFVLDSLHLMPENLRCYLYGEITPYSEDYQLLQKFFPHLHFGKNPEKLTFGVTFEDLPEHRYFSLYNIFFATQTSKK